MCLAIPGRVLSVEGNEALVDFVGTRRAVRVDLVEARPGDYVIVHVGYAIEVLDEESARETLELFREILEGESPVV